MKTKFEVSRDTNWSRERSSMRKLRDINKAQEDNMWPGYPYSFNILIDMSNEHAYYNDELMDIESAIKEVSYFVMTSGFECKHVKKGSWISGDTEASGEPQDILDSPDSDEVEMVDSYPAKLWMAMSVAIFKSRKDAKESKKVNDDLIVVYFDGDAEFGRVDVMKGSDHEYVEKFVNLFTTGSEKTPYGSDYETEDDELVKEVKDACSAIGG